jgi:hypothetical protein
MADVTPHPLAAEAEQALQGVTKLAADCELAAKVMAETGTFETGQAILKEAAAALTALSEQNAALAAQVAELKRERDAAQEAHIFAYAALATAEAKVARLEGKIADALGRYQVTHIHAALTEGTPE